MTLKTRIDRLTKAMPCPVCHGRNTMSEIRVIDVPEGQPEPDLAALHDEVPSACPGCGAILTPKKIFHILLHDGPPPRTV